MRLTQLLMMWPKKRPNGNIWIGKESLLIRFWQCCCQERTRWCAQLSHGIWNLSRKILKGGKTLSTMNQLFLWHFLASLAEKYPFFVTLKFCREKKNIHICLNPILTPEEERMSVAARQGALRVDQVLFRWRNFYPVLGRFVFTCFSSGWGKLE